MTNPVAVNSRRKGLRRPRSFVCLALIATVAVAAVQVWLGRMGLPFDPERLPVIRLCAGILILLGSSILIEAVAAAHLDRGTTKWWDGAETRDGQLQWSEVYDLVSASQEVDPLAFQSASRSKKRPLEFVWTCAVCFAAVAVSAQVLCFLWNPSTPWWLSSAGPDRVFTALASVSGNLTAYLALLTSGIAIVFTYHQLRAKVRADSRQQWIEKARSLVAETLALRRRRSGWLPGSVRSRERLEEVRLELELMLNPSERDHRLLMYLVQRLSFLGEAGPDDIQDAVAVRCEIAKAGPLDRKGCGGAFVRTNGGSSHPCLGPAWNEIIYATDEGDLVSYIMRLSHAVLKREWERVKHTR